MQKLVQGIHHFQDNLFSPQRELFERLAQGQQPDALFITCSDSRINPNLITHTQPGELFILRNAGNIVPAHGTAVGGEEATIEFAVVGLGIKDIIVCGHSHCGAINALLAPEGIREIMPAMCSWLGHAEPARRIVKENYPNLDNEKRLNVVIQENVLVQLGEPANASGGGGGPRAECTEVARLGLQVRNRPGLRLRSAARSLPRSRPSHRRSGCGWSRTTIDTAMCDLKKPSRFAVESRYRIVARRSTK